MSRILFEYLRNRPPCMEWADLPTPVTPWGDTHPNLWVKRDDQSSVRYGGSKVRKLEWLLADPRWAQGPVLSVGAIGSHHLRALAEFLALQERRLHALVCPQVATVHARRNFARLLDLEAQIIPMASRASLPLAWLRYRLGDTAPKAPYLAAGGSDAVGLLAFVEAGLELAAQIKAGVCPAPARIYIAAGTAGSVAGLQVGLSLAGCATQLVAVSSVEKIAFNRLMLARKVRQCRQELARWGCSLRPQCSVPVRITHRQLGAGYGVPTSPANAAMEQAVEAQLKLEPTYTGKVLAQLLVDEAQGRVPVMLWNTHASSPQWNGEGVDLQRWPQPLVRWSKRWPTA